ncbi:unnamed protein product, partial [marine sediment metagenome]
MLIFKSSDPFRTHSLKIGILKYIKVYILIKEVK